MRSIRAFMPILLLGLLAFATGTAAAETNRLSKPGGLTIQSPCNSEFVEFQGTATVVYHQEGSHGQAHMRYVGDGKDTDGRNYHINLEAEGHFAVTSDPAQVFFFPYRAHVEGHGKGCDFSMKGNVGILVVNGAPTDDAVMDATTKCENGDGDRDRDNDKDSDKGRDSDKDRH